MKKEEILKPKAKEHQGTRNDLTSRPIGQEVQTRKTIAKLSKVGEGTVERVKFIRDHADEQTKQDLKKGNEKLIKISGKALPVSKGGRGNEDGIREVARQLGVSHSWIQDLLKISNAPKIVQKAVEHNLIKKKLNILAKKAMVV